MVYRMPTSQCSHRPTALPALLVGVCVLLVATRAPLSAQTTYRLERRENFRQNPDPHGKLLATVATGTRVRGDSTEGGWAAVTLDGWIWARSVRADRGRGFDLAVSAPNGENLRAAPNGAVEARLLSGFLLNEVERDSGWVHVQRSGWIWGQSLAQVNDDSAPTPSTSAPAPAAPSPSGPSLDRAVVARRAAVLATPTGDTLAVLGQDASATVLARTGDWARVRLEGWVRTSDLSPANDGVLRGVSGAEVRATPNDYTGRLLQWDLQYISLQTGDDIRRDIPAGQPYMLARGPLPETGFVYVLLNAQQRARVAGLQPLTTVTIIGRVRTGRSQYLGNPVLDLVDLSVAKP